MRNVAFARWDPLRDLISLQEQIGHLVGTDAPGWTPPVDLYETATDYILSAELPGLAREQIDIHAEENRIVIRGERGASCHIPCEQYHRVERGHGRFSRAFVCLTPSTSRRWPRSLQDGILTVTMPKLAAPGGRRVSVT
jgi:HSP20 family protein